MSRGPIRDKNMARRPIRDQYKGPIRRQNALETKGDDQSGTIRDKDISREPIRDKDISRGPGTRICPWDESGTRICPEDQLTIRDKDISRGPIRNRDMSRGRIRDKNMDRGPIRDQYKGPVRRQNVLETKVDDLQRYWKKLPKKIYKPGQRKEHGY